MNYKQSKNEGIALHCHTFDPRSVPQEFENPMKISMS